MMESKHSWLFLQVCVFFLLLLCFYEVMVNYFLIEYYMLFENEDVLGYSAPSVTQLTLL